MSKSQKENEAAVESRLELRIRVIGVGGAGCSIAERMMRDEEFANASFTVINTEKVELAKSFAKDKLHLECKLLRGLGTGGDPALGRVAAQEKLEEIQALCADIDVVF
ncbi:MAG: cell division protein FtsZ, partial [Candidatus Binatia bacterium]